MLIARRTLPERTSLFLENLVLSDKESPALRAKVLTGLVRNQRRSVARVLAAVGQQDGLPPAMLDVWREYLRDDGHARRVGEFRTLARQEDRAQRELGYAVLLAMEANPKTPAKARTEAAGRSSQRGRIREIPPACCLRSAAPTRSIMPIRFETT